MKVFDKVTTQQLWEAIEQNAQMGQRHLNWVEYLDNIKVLCALIDERTQAFHRRMRLEQVLEEHQGVFQLGAESEDDATSSGRGCGTPRAAASKAGGDRNGL